MRLRRSLPVLLAIGAALAVALLVALVPALRDALSAAVRGDTAGLRHDMRGAGGVALVLALCVVHVVVWFPAELINAAAGFVYGAWVAVPMMLFAWLVSALCSYTLGALAGRPLIRALAGEERLTRVDALLERGGVPVLIAARLIPVLPFTLLGLAAGAARVPVFRFGWTTVVGFTPITVASVIVGHRLDDFSPTDPVLLACVGVGLVLLALVRPMSRRLKL